MLILGIHPGYHDACVCLYNEYRLLASVALERLTRRKIDGGRVPTEAVDECLAIAGYGRSEVDAVVLTRGVLPSRYFTHLTGGRRVERAARWLLNKEKNLFMERECVRYRQSDCLALFDAGRFLRDMGFRADTRAAFCNHHLAHALPTLFHTDWPEALLYTADGGGDNVHYSIRVFRDGRLTTLYGGDEALLVPMRIDSVARVYGFATQALGYRMLQHEGKLTGLAAYGRPVLYEALAARFRIEEDGEIRSDFESNRAIRDFVFEIARGIEREHVACSVQALVERFIPEALRRILARHPVRYLGLSGGLFANVLLNQRLAESLPIEEIFIYPAMSDQGLACGGVLQYLLERDGLERWLAERYRLDTLYYGRDFTTAIDELLGGNPAFTRVSTRPVEAVAELLEQGRIVAVYTRGSEYGPRALGARSILAAPVEAEINNRLNKRLERSEFMPFAPVVTAEDAEAVFELGPRTRYAAEFMTITCRVRDAWRDRIPAVVHVDGTARPQIIARAQNPLYYDILAAYKARTGIPVLINTSFNVHEEPIVYRPEECASALADDRVDFVATANGVYARAGGR